MAANKAESAPVRKSDPVQAKLLSSRIRASARTRAPFAQSPGSAHSSGEWLLPSRQGTKIMPMGAIRATKTPSCPAPLGNRVLLKPAAMDASSIVLWINGEQPVGKVWLSNERV